jgi:hypothetical protein
VSKIKKTIADYRPFFALVELLDAFIAGELIAKDTKAVTRRLLKIRKAVLAAPQVPLPVSERPWEREGWCDEHGRCWLYFELDNGLRTPSWRLARPCDYDFTVKGVVWLALPHDALPVSLPQAGEVEA